MYSVLIVDDEVMIKHSLTKLIDGSQYGFRVNGEAEDGSEALALWERLKPDLIITDISMPVMDGLELIEEIRKRSQDTEIVILSGYDDFGYAQQAIRYGITDYVLKPVRQELLENLLRKVADRLDQKGRSFKERGQRLWECRGIAASLTEHLWMLREPEALLQLSDFHQQLMSRGLNLAQCLEHLEDVIALAEAELIARSGGKMQELPKPRLSAAIASQDEVVLHTRISIAAFAEQVRMIRNWGQHHGIMKAVRYIEAHYANEYLSLSQAANEAGMSDSYFSRCFKEELGLSFIEYVIKLRMEKAKDLLEAAESKTNEVAHAVGYSDYPHFSKSFKKYCGVAPNEYKKRLTGK
ncbi:response regulator [Paenibacillus aceris]|uniref:Two-component system response regulator YesN n=1 Tax=Paenibacillus aceris TaxID=869555 RepID=A0ABS4HXE5_9BACL|nr:response regulator [Paenibacillus aceris]MBP1963297.1 two-component system response regulator YesN [Paenibacillus aceris]NHW36197.1 response regulator [Paenibacillus aceris]